jgi:hypothetical protein
MGMKTPRVLEANMNTERIVRIVAGMLILISVVLSHLHRPAWLLLTLFVGANLFQSGFTRWCLMEDFLAMAGVPSCCPKRHLIGKAKEEVQ